MISSTWTRLAGRWLRFATGAERGRCWWAESDALLAAYHDDEWGTPVHDDVHLFEMLTLEGFQAGLSWLTILRKRDAFREAFRGFDPLVVSRFDDRDRARLMADAAIVRNRAKIDATIDNAAAFWPSQRNWAVSTVPASDSCPRLRRACLPTPSPGRCRPPRPSRTPCRVT